MKTLTYDEISSVAGGSSCVDYSAAAGAAVGLLAWGGLALFTDGGIAAVPGSWGAFSGAGGTAGIALGEFFCS